MGAPSAGETVVVVTGGDPVAPHDVPPGLDGAVVVAADSGVDRALELGLTVAVVVGDLDSVTEDGLAAATSRGAALQRHPEAKDATDLELALAAALELGPRRLVVIGGNGGRLDHLLANALLLASDALADVEVVAQMGAARVTVIRGAAELTGVLGGHVTLLPVGGPARGITTAGLLYPLVDEDLHPGSTRGVSNELLGSTAHVQLRGGTLLAVQPGTTGAHHQRIH
jgi:thiamine pyrophosphokinase